MRLFLTIVVILLGGEASFAYPPLLEDSDGECSALDQRIADLSSHDGTGRLSVGALYGSSSSTPGAAAFVRDHYSALPSATPCAIAYWRCCSIRRTPCSRLRCRRRRRLPRRRRKRRLLRRSRYPRPRRIRQPRFDRRPRRHPQRRPDLSGGGIHAAYARGCDPRRLSRRQGRRRPLSADAGKGRPLLYWPERGAPGTAWCKFNVSLRKGAYSIAATANNAPLGQFPFTVIGN